MLKRKIVRNTRKHDLSDNIKRGFHRAVSRTVEEAELIRGVDCIQLTQDEKRWRTLVNTVIHLRVR